MIDWSKKLDLLPTSGRINIHLADGRIIRNVIFSKDPAFLFNIPMPDVLIVDINLSSWL